MILDTSALAAIFFGEPEAEHFTKIIHDADSCSISAVNFVELFMVIEGQIGAEAAQQTEMYFERARIVVEPVSVEQARIARQAFRDYGRGRHKASLNFGDCFAYAMSKVTGEPLLFKGDDFRKTDIIAAA
ncbi:MAG: type II toxin-antitoxin system VapC family toxin [Acidobacteriia bacterium]|nr:type II toxin-antitoxin system VapC family toxin [Terriglobia bacterium]